VSDLAEDLRHLANLVEEGRIPLSAEAKIEQAVERLEPLATQYTALLRAAELLAPDAGRWHQAALLAAAVRHFEADAWPKIQAGVRLPAGDLEKMLALAFNCGPFPKTQRRLWEIING
jgi:hypothetical protein